MPVSGHEATTQERLENKMAQRANTVRNKVVGIDRLNILARHCPELGMTVRLGLKGVTMDCKQSFEVYISAPDFVGLESLRIDKIETEVKIELRQR